VTRSLAVAISDVVEIEVETASYVLEVIQGTGRFQFVIAMSNTSCALSCGVYRDQQHHCIDKSCVELLGLEILWLAFLLLKLCQIEMAKISSTSCSIYLCSIYSCFVRSNFCVKGL
jgi:hypothetical protein